LGLAGGFSSVELFAATLRRSSHRGYPQVPRHSLIRPGTIDTMELLIVPPTLTSDYSRIKFGPFNFISPTCGWYSPRQRPRWRSPL